MNRERVLQLTLRWSVALVWLGTGFLVLHPVFRDIGRRYLSRLSIGDWAMWTACAGEVALGLRLGVGRARGWTVLVQLALVSGFTVVLATLDPFLLVNPFGMLSKNIPLLLVAGASFVLEREGFSPRARRLLLGAVAFIWIHEGLMPKILFQQPVELAVVENSGLAPMDASPFLVFLGALQICSAILLLALRGRWRSAVLGAQLAGLIALPILVGMQAPRLVVHPFAPLIKNLPIMAATATLLWARFPSRDTLPGLSRRPWRAPRS